MQNYFLLKYYYQVCIPLVATSFFFTHCNIYRTLKNKFEILELRNAIQELKLCRFIDCFWSFFSSGSCSVWRSYPGCAAWWFSPRWAIWWSSLCLASWWSSLCWASWWSSLCWASWWSSLCWESWWSSLRRTVWWSSIIRERKIYVWEKVFNFYWCLGWIILNQII